MSFHIYGSLSDASGGSNSPAFPVVTFANTNTLAVTEAGSGYLAIWNQQYNVPFLGTLNSEGLLTRRVPLAGNRFFAPQLAFNGGRIAIVDASAFSATTIDISIFKVDQRQRVRRQSVSRTGVRPGRTFGRRNDHQHWEHDPAARRPSLKGQAVGSDALPTACLLSLIQHASGGGRVLYVPVEAF
jgi:hypothetical protein